MWKASVAEHLVALATSGFLLTVSNILVRTKLILAYVNRADQGALVPRSVSASYLSILASCWRILQLPGFHPLAALASIAQMFGLVAVRQHALCFPPTNPFCRLVKPPFPAPLPRFRGLGSEMLTCLHADLLSLVARALCEPNGCACCADFPG